MQHNKIYCMDCIKGMRQLAQDSVDLIVTDPPYMIHAKGGGGLITKANKKIFKKIDEAFETNFNPLPFLAEVPRLQKKINLYVWCSLKQVNIYLTWAEQHKLHYDLLAWHKTNPIPLNMNKYLSDTEYCIFIREKGAYFNSKLRDMRKYKKYFVTSLNQNDNDHPTPKPVRIIRPAIEISSKPHDVILDPFLGSGTTAVVAKQLNRRYVGFEIQKKYCQMANARLQQEQLRAYL